MCLHHAVGVQGRGRRLQHVVRAGAHANNAEAANLSTASAIISVDGAPKTVTTAPTPAKHSIPWIPVAIGGALLAAGIVKKLQAHGSMDNLVDRGYLNEGRGVRTDPFMAGVMKKVNTVQFEELSQDAISAARQRRSRERANFKVELDDVELPENHPWATKKPLSKQDDDAVKARLQVRRNRAAANEQNEAGANGRPRRGH